MDVFRINYAVGSGLAKNNAGDVKLVQALLNVYLRSKKKTTIKISTKIDDETKKAIIDFQKEVKKLAKPDGRVDPGGNTLKKLMSMRNDSFTVEGIVAPDFGRVTWESEGAEGGRYHSRRLHVPSNTSGLTIGRGYDFRRKKQSQIITDLNAAGLEPKKVAILKNAAGLFGNTAKQFVIDNDLLDFQISAQTQKNLFKISYDDEASQVKRICTKSDVVKLYGKCDWEKLNSAIKDMLIDLKFRGDYTSQSRKHVQKSASANDLQEFKKQIISKSNWSSVPSDRFERRKKFIEAAK